jgi:hypothetical protein
MFVFGQGAELSVASVAAVLHVLMHFSTIKNDRNEQRICCVRCNQIDINDAIWARSLLQLERQSRILLFSGSLLQMSSAA